MAYGFNDDKSTYDLDAIAGSIATIEASPAVSSHVVGEYVFYDNQLCMVTAAIAAGEPLEVGTNLAATSVGGELGRLNVYSVERVSETVTTGATGNIPTRYLGNGHDHVVAAYATGTSAFLRTWVSPITNHWFFTAVDPNTGTTLNNTSLGITYLVIRISRMS